MGLRSEEGVYVCEVYENWAGRLILFQEHLPSWDAEAVRVVYGYLHTVLVEEVKVVQVYGPTKVRV